MQIILPIAVTILCNSVTYVQKKFSHSITEKQIFFIHLLLIHSYIPNYNTILFKIFQNISYKIISSTTQPLISF